MTSDYLYTFGSNKRLLEALNDHAVVFLIIGGVAVMFHGCREEAADLDILLEPTVENGSNFLDGVRSLGLHPHFTAQEFAHSDKQIPLKIEYYADILTPPSEIDFRELYARGLNGHVNDVSVRFVALADLITLKEIAVSRLQSELSKHQGDLDCLRKKQNIALREPKS